MKKKTKKILFTILPILLGAASIGLFSLPFLWTSDNLSTYQYSLTGWVLAFGGTIKPTPLSDSASIISSIFNTEVTYTLEPTILASLICVALGIVTSVLYFCFKEKWHNVLTCVSINFFFAAVILMGLVQPMFVASQENLVSYEAYVVTWGIPFSSFAALLAGVASFFKFN